MPAPRVVVGVDGSAQSVAALRAGIEEAALRGATVEAVLMWHLPAWAVLSGAGRADVRPFAHQTEARARRLLADAVAQARHTLPRAWATDIAEIVVEGRAAPLLVDMSRGADLLVVGARGAGGFEGLRLGSVSAQCAAHARCPIMIVPAPADEPRPAATS